MKTIETIKEIRNAKDCVGLVEGTPVMFRNKKLIYAGTTKYSPNNWKTTQRMIEADEEGEPIEYEIDVSEIRIGKVSPENALYYPYKEMLEAKK